MSFAYHERESGIYPATFAKIEEFEYEDKDSGEMQYRWRWVFQELSDPTTAGEMDTLTSRSFKPRTNGLKLFTGILGRLPVAGDDPTEQVGTKVNVVYGPNTRGRLTITDVKRIGDKAPRVPEAVPTAEVTTPAVADELPF